MKTVGLAFNSSVKGVLCTTCDNGHFLPPSATHISRHLDESHATHWNTLPQIQQVYRDQSKEEMIEIGVLQACRDHLRQIEGTNIDTPPALCDPRQIATSLREKARVAPSIAPVEGLTIHKGVACTLCPKQQPGSLYQPPAHTNHCKRVHKDLSSSTARAATRTAYYQNISLSRGSGSDFFRVEVGRHQTDNATTFQHFPFILLYQFIDT